MTTSQQSTLDDRRATPRQPTDLAARWWLHWVDAPQVGTAFLTSGRIINVSEGGLCMADRGLEIPSGARVALLLLLEQGTFVVEGKVAWRRPRQDAHATMGIAAPIATQLLENLGSRAPSPTASA